MGIKLDKIRYDVNKRYTPQNFILISRKFNTLLPLLQQFFLVTNIMNKFRNPKMFYFLHAA
jgi:hypothetical protein